MNTFDIIKSFRQGGTGNCVSIAIIKAGIQTFGVNRVFDHNWEGNTCTVTMRDGYQLAFSEKELEIGSQGSHFLLMEYESIFNYANLCFTAMAKRAQIEDNDDFEDMTFEQAIETLNDGEYYLHGPDWLGLRHYVRRSGRRYVWQYKGMIGASSKHAFFVSEGYEDNYGKPDKLSGLERRFCKWIRVAETPMY